MLLDVDRPRCLVLTYYTGAAILTVSAGLIALALLKEANLTTDSSKTASGSTYILAGVLLLALATWAWRRKAHDPDQAPPDAGAAHSRIADWSKRATTSRDERRHLAEYPSAALPDQSGSGGRRAVRASELVSATNAAPPRWP